MTRAADLAKLIAGGGSITVDDNSTNITLKSTDADSNLGPILDLLRDGGSPADSDFIGQVRFQAKDDGGNIHEYAKIFGQIADVTGGTEDGILNIRTVLNGTDTRRIDLGVTETVFNEDSADVDFRVESNGEENMLFVDGGENRVGIGTTGGSGETLTVTKSGADATVRVNGVSGQEASLKLQGNNTITNTFKIASEEDDSGLTIQKWNGSAYVTHLKSDANGHITKPLQPAFLVTKSGAQDNLTAGSEITITFDSEIFDQNADFSSNTFTAPVTGRYYLQVKLNLGSTDADSTNFQTRIITSNRTHTFNFDPSAFDKDTSNHTVMAATLADMDANDTCTFKIFQSSGLDQCDVSSSSTASGFLAC